jgi:hypothetical protein
MLGASVAMLALVSALVAFGSWPGSTSGKQVDEVILRQVTRPKAQQVAVGAAAIEANRRADERRRIAVVRAERKASGSTPARTQVADKRTGAEAPTTAAGTTVAAAPGDSSPAATVRQQTKNVTQNVQQTTQDVGTQVGNTVDQTTKQVNQVVDQVVGGVQQQTAPVTQPVQGTVDNTTNTVTNTVGGVKDTAGSLPGP